MGVGGLRKQAGQDEEGDQATVPTFGHKSESA